MNETRRVIRSLVRLLAAAGYGDVPGPHTAAAALLYKPVEELVLTLGLETSTFYRGRLTGSFCLARSFSWPGRPRGFPRASVQRIGPLLSVGERVEFGGRQFETARNVDLWFDVAMPAVDQVLARAVRAAEERLLTQSLIDEVRESDVLRSYEETLRRIQGLVPSLSTRPAGLQYQPTRRAASLPESFLWAAELVLGGTEQATPHNVVNFALDAWRSSVLMPR